MTTLYLARHGETVWHADNRYTGSSDVALTEKGVAQGEALARWSLAHGITRVYSSHLERAVVTARPSAESLHVPLVQDGRLREVHFGDGEGLTTNEMRARFPDALRDFQARPATSPLPSAESGTAALDRAWPALLEIADGLRHQNSLPGAAQQKALIVMHSTLMRLILCRALGIPVDEYRTVFPSVTNVAITAIRMPAAGDRGAALICYNTPPE